MDPQVREKERDIQMEKTKRLAAARGQPVMEKMEPQGHGGPLGGGGAARTTTATEKEARLETATVKQCHPRGTKVRTGLAAAQGTR